MSDETGIDDTDITTQVVERVAEKEGVDPVDLTEPIEDVIDPNALNSIFSERSGGNPRSAGTVQFIYHGYEIVVDSDRNISIEKRSE